MTELEAAQQKRIAQLEEELAAMARQLAALTRYVFGKRSERTPPPASPASRTWLWRLNRKALPPRRRRSPAGPKAARRTRAELLPGNLPVEETVLILKRKMDAWIPRRSVKTMA